MGESGVFRFHNWVLNMNHVVQIEYCLQQIYVIYDTGDEKIVKDPEICAAFFEYMGGLFPDLANHDDRQMAMQIARVARRKIYAEAMIIDKKLSTIDGGVEFKTGPGFAGHQEHVPMTRGGDPATGPGVSQRAKLPNKLPRKAGCCGKGGGQS